MNIFSSKAWMKAFSGLFINFSAGYFALIFITSNGSSDTEYPVSLLILTTNLLGGIVFLLASVKCEERIEKS